MRFSLLIAFAAAALAAVLVWSLVADDVLTSEIPLGPTGPGGDLPEESEPLYLREARVEPGDFTFSSLHEHDDLVRLDESRRAVFESCMAERGFPEPPEPEEYDEGRLTENARRYAIAAGDGPSRTEPPEIESVRLPDGSTVQLGTTMTRDSCRWQADSYPSGVDPLHREAMRTRLDELRIEADLAAFADREAEPTLRRFQTCSAVDDPWALLAASGDQMPGDPRVGAGAMARECATEELTAELNEVRAEHHYSIATRGSTERLVSAWVDLVDAELAALGK